MPDKLYQVLSRRYANRDKRKPWIFWHRYRDRKKRNALKTHIKTETDNESLM